MKNLFAVLIAVLCAVSAQAQTLTYTSGKSDIFKQEITFNVVFNDSNPIIDGKNQNAEEFYNARSVQEYINFVSDMEGAHPSFVTYYNEKRKGSIKSVIVIDDDAPYTLNVNVTTINVGNGGGMVFAMNAKSGGAVIHGTMSLVDNSSGETVCEMQFSGVKGMLGPKFSLRAISVYRYLADALLKSIK